MRLIAIEKARALALIELNELNGNGNLRFLELVPHLVESFHFASYPQKFEDLDFQGKGATFSSGRIGNIVIDALTIYDGALLVETLSSTADSKRALEHMLAWGVENLGLTYRTGMVRRWGYISHLVFETEVSILQEMSSPLGRLAAKISDEVGGLWGPLRYQPISLVIGHDPTIRKNGIAPLSIQHRVNTPVDENRYFSEAPLPTDVHIKFLAEFEAEILQSA